MRARRLMPAVAAVGVLIAGCGRSAGPAATSATRPPASTHSETTPAARAPSSARPASDAVARISVPGRPAAPRPPAGSPASGGGAPFPVSRTVLTLVDHSRTVEIGGVRRPRRLVTIVRHPAGAARPPFPLVVFGHGFAVTPRPYARLLRAWASAGYVVAAPIFPLENANAPGGPNEDDLVNQPRDMSFVISRLVALSDRASGVLAGAIDSSEIAVSGHSDGGETALAVAYDRQFLDPRVRAAVILSCAEIPGVGGFDFPAPSPPLLATQGTADMINPPHFTSAFFRIAPRPKFLLAMFGASHLPPYVDEQPQLGIVERVTIAFLDQYLKHEPRGLARMAAAGDDQGVSTLTARP